MISRSLRLFLAFVVMPVLAVCAAIASLSTVLERSLPGRAVALPLVDANAYTSKALEDMSGEGLQGEGNLQRLALEAGARTFNVEPTNATAVSLMAMGHQSGGDISAARRLYEDALLVAKRERLANLWLVEDASQNGRVGFILDRYDVLLRTGGAASDVLFDVLGTALREEAIVPHLEARLVRRPPWSEQFWLKVTPNAQAIENIGSLRLRLLEKGIENPAGNDADILRRLVDNGHLEVAFSLFNRLVDKDARAPGAIHNEDFAEPARFAPFDWETFAESGYGAEVDPAAKALVLYAQDPVEALYARQLVETPPGRYLLKVVVSDSEPLRSIPVILRARCAGTSGPALMTMPVNESSESATVAVPGGACRHLWLEVWARRDAATSASVDDVFIDSISMRPLG